MARLLVLSLKKDVFLKIDLPKVVRQGTRHIAVKPTMELLGLCKAGFSAPISCIAVNTATRASARNLF